MKAAKGEKVEAVVCVQSSLFRPGSARLLKGLERTSLRERMFAGLARDEIIGLADGQGGPEVEIDPPRGALRARHGAKKQRQIRLRTLIKFHIGMDRKAVAALHAHALPFPVGVEIAAIDGKCIGFTDGTANR